MNRYLLRRLLQVLPLVLVVVVLNFLLVHMTPGDPAAALAGEDAPQEYVQQLRESYGLNDPLPVQLATYLGKLVTGDLGFSFAYRRPDADLNLSRIPPTLLLILVSHIPAIVGGTLLGAVAARNRGTWLDRVITALSLSLYSVPVFWSGMVLILIFALTLGWFPTSGMVNVATTGADPIDVARHLVLPATALGLFTLPTYVRLTRAAVLEVMEDDYIRTSQAVGFHPRTTFYRHALRNALLPTVTTAGISLGFIFAGALLTETVFAWPGLGSLMYQSVFHRDYPVLMGVFLITAISVAVMSLLVDLLYVWIDPRVSYD